MINSLGFKRYSDFLQEALCRSITSRIAGGKRKIWGEAEPSCKSF